MIDMTNNTIFRLNNLNETQVRISYQQSSGKLIDRGSDDTQIFAKEIYIEDKISVYTGIESQIVKTNAQNSNADSALAEMKKLLEYVKSETIKALNDTSSASARSSIAVQIEGVKKNILMLGNERIEGEYLFAGSDSIVKPFSQDATTGKVTYEGNGYLKEVAVEFGSYRDKGVNGFDMMFFSDSTIDIKGTNPSFDENSKVSFNPSEDRIVDENGNEWKFIDNDNADGDNDITTGVDNDKLFKFDFSGTNTNDYITMSALGADKFISDNNLGDANNVTNSLTSLTSTLVKPTFSIIKNIDTNTAESNSQIVFNENDTRVIDQDGNEWKFYDSNADGIIDDSEKTRLYKFDFNGKTEEYFSVLKTDNSGEFVTSSVDHVNLDSGGTKNLINPTFETKKNIFDVLDNLIDALENNDTSKMRIGLDEITESYDGVNTAHADLGARNKVFELSYQRVTSKLTQLNIFYQEVSAADPAKLAIEAKSLELTFVSLYSTINRLNKLSLVNYLN